MRVVLTHHVADHEHGLPHAGADDIGGHDGGPFRFSRQHIQRLNQQQLQASQFFFLTGGPDVADHLCYLHSLDPSFFG